MNHLQEAKQEYKNSKKQETTDTGNACFQHKLAYGAFKDKVLHDNVIRHLEIAINPKYDASLVYKIFDKIFRSTVTHTRIGNVSGDQKLANQLRIDFTRIFKKHKINSFLEKTSGLLILQTCN